MSEDKKFFADVDPVELRNNAEKGLREYIEMFENTEIDALPLIQASWNIWDNMNDNPKLKEKLDAEIEKRQKVIDDISGSSQKGGITARDRYNPHQWLMNIPTDMINDKYTYLADRAKALLNLIESVK